MGLCAKAVEAKTGFIFKDRLIQVILDDMKVQMAEEEAQSRILYEEEYALGANL